MKNLILSFCIILLANIALAQNTHFTTSGTIDYEKSINMFALLKKYITDDNNSFMQQAYDAYKKNKPQFKKQKSTLTFANNKTLFTPLPDENAGNDFFGGNPSTEQNNTTYTDLTSDISTTQKKVYEQIFLVKDTVRKIHWKITDETRDIAGYTCRRANALIMDSIYVVAFYTNEIAVSGGPESFTGLPGMILGVALPHENVTWFATKVVDTAVPANTIKPPVKGKAVNNKQLRTTLEAALKDWGDYAQAIFKALLM